MHKFVLKSKMYSLCLEHCSWFASWIICIPTSAWRQRLLAIPIRM